MSKAFLLSAFFLLPAGLADGFISFNTRDVNHGVDAPATRDGQNGPGPCFRARLVLVKEGGVLGALYPETNFRRAAGLSSVVERYVNPVVVRVPDQNPGEWVIVRMQVFDGEQIHAESANLAMQLGTTDAPAPLPSSFTGPSIRVGGSRPVDPATSFLRIDLYEDFVLLRPVRARMMEVEYSDDLQTWQPNPDCIRDTNTTNHTRFYRVIYR